MPGALLLQRLFEVATDDDDDERYTLDKESPALPAQKSLRVVGSSPAFYVCLFGTEKLVLRNGAGVVRRAREPQRMFASGFQRNGRPARKKRSPPPDRSRPE